MINHSKTTPTCYTCKHFIPAWRINRPTNGCGRFRADVNLVTGDVRYQSPETLRGYGAGCGPEGKFHESKPKPISVWGRLSGLLGLG